MKKLNTLPSKIFVSVVAAMAVAHATAENGTQTAQQVEKSVRVGEILPEKTNFKELSIEVHGKGLTPEKFRAFSREEIAKEYKELVNDKNDLNIDNKNYDMSIAVGKDTYSNVKNLKFANHVFVNFPFEYAVKIERKQEKSGDSYLREQPVGFFVDAGCPYCAQQENGLKPANLVNGQTHFIFLSNALGSYKHLNEFLWCVKNDYRPEAVLSWFDYRVNHQTDDVKALFEDWKKAFVKEAGELAVKKRLKANIKSAEDYSELSCKKTPVNFNAALNATAMPQNAVPSTFFADYSTHVGVILPVDLDGHLTKLKTNNYMRTQVGYENLDTPAVGWEVRDARYQYWESKGAPMKGVIW